MTEFHEKSLAEVYAERATVEAEIEASLDRQIETDAAIAAAETVPALRIPAEFADEALELLKQARWSGQLGYVDFATARNLIEDGFASQPLRRWAASVIVVAAEAAREVARIIAKSFDEQLEREALHDRADALAAEIIARSANSWSEIETKAGLARALDAEGEDAAACRASIARDVDALTAKAA